MKIAFFTAHPKGSSYIPASVCVVTGNYDQRQTEMRFETTDISCFNGTETDRIHNCLHEHSLIVGYQLNPHYKNKFIPKTNNVVCKFDLNTHICLKTFTPTISIRCMAKSVGIDFEDKKRENYIHLNAGRTHELFKNLKAELNIYYTVYERAIKEGKLKFNRTIIDTSNWREESENIAKEYITSKCIQDRTQDTPDSTQSIQNRLRLLQENDRRESIRNQAAQRRRRVHRNNLWTQDGRPVRYG